MAFSKKDHNTFVVIDFGHNDNLWYIAKPFIVNGVVEDVRWFNFIFKIWDKDFVVTQYCVNSRRHYIQILKKIHPEAEIIDRIPLRLCIGSRE